MKIISILIVVTFIGLMFQNCAPSGASSSASNTQKDSNPKDINEMKEALKGYFAIKTLDGISLGTIKFGRNGQINILLTDKCEVSGSGASLVKSEAGDLVLFTSNEDTLLEVVNNCPLTKTANQEYPAPVQVQISVNFFSPICFRGKLVWDGDELDFCKYQDLEAEPKTAVSVPL